MVHRDSYDTLELPPLTQDQTPPQENWAPLQAPAFRAFWLASFASNVGSWMHNAAAAWLMTSLTPSPLLAALVQSAGTLPLFLFSLPAGAYADLLDRRRLLLVTQTAILAGAFAIGILTLAGLTGPWTLLALTFVMGCGGAWNAPAWAASIPRLVPRNQLPAALTLNSVQFNAATTTLSTVTALGSAAPSEFHAASPWSRDVIRAPEVSNTGRSIR